MTTLLTWQTFYAIFIQRYQLIQEDFFKDSLRENKKVKSLSLVRLFATPWTIAHHAPLSMVILQQELCIGLPCPPRIAFYFIDKEYSLSSNLPTATQSDL